MNPTQKTIDYYDANAAEFLAKTADVEFGAFQKKFADMLPRGGRILDLGCGSGRDSLAFLHEGFQVDAMDGSAAMVEAASKTTGLPVVHALFDDFQPQGEYDGIWACSSLLHVEKDELPDLIAKYAEPLKPGGVFYLSFKLGDHEGLRNGRWFTDLSEGSARAILDGIDGLGIVEMAISGDVRPGRQDEKWLNVWCVKRSPERDAG